MYPSRTLATPAAQVFDMCCDAQSMTFQRSLLGVADLFEKALKPSWMSLKFSRELDNQEWVCRVPCSPDWVGVVQMHGRFRLSGCVQRGS